MNSAKRQKLSLSKSKAKRNEAPDRKSQTILSMFKKQDEKTKMTIEPARCDISSGSEGDVVITKVEKADPFLSSAQNAESRNWKTLGQFSKNRKKRSKLSLRKVQSAVESGEHSHWHSELETHQNQLSPGRYNLRKRSTEPLMKIDSGSEDEIVDDSSEDSMHDKSKIVATQCDTSSSQKDNADIKVADIIFEKIENTALKGREKNARSGKLFLRKRKTCDNGIVGNKDEFFKQRKLPSESHDSHRTNSVNVPGQKLRQKGPADSPQTKSFTEIKHSTSQGRDLEKSVSSKLSPREIPSKQKFKSLKNISKVGKSSKEMKSLSNSPSVLSFMNKEKRIPHDTSEQKKKLETGEDSRISEPIVIEAETEKPYCPFTRTSNTRRHSKEIKTEENEQIVEEKQKLEDRSQVSEDTEKVEDKKDEKVIEGVNSEEVQREETEYRVPYYLENFRTILQTVFDSHENVRLFNKSDIDYITAFKNLEEDAQKLYIRLFSRKLSWLQVSKLNYSYSKSLEELIDQLTDVGLLMSGESLDDLDTALGVMSAPDLQMLAKSFHLNVAGASKPVLTEQLKKKSQQSSIGKLFKGGASLSIEKTMLARASGYLGKLCRLIEEPRAVFIRVLMLFSLYNTNFDEDSGGGGGQNQLFQMLMVNIGRVVYPKYTVNRQRPVFKDRETLIRFEKALQCELDLQAVIEKNKWSDAYTVYMSAREAGKKLLKDKAILKWDSNLPLFLRPYTAGSVYVRIENQGVEILQRLKKYKEAVELLQELLAEDVYCTQYRGHWYDRLALNLDAHLKSPARSLDAISNGLNDERVTSGRRLSLYQRAEKICGAPKSKFADRMSHFQHDKVITAPEHYVEGMVLPDASAAKMKYQFIMSGNTDSVTLCAVEELALDHYANNGYPEGLHWEGALISNLFCLLCWDLIFMDVKDVFQGPFQTHPLDKDTPDFYLNRRNVIDERLTWIRESSEEGLCGEVAQVWEDHEGTVCAGINWERFTGPQKLQGLIRCMGGRVISAILERYVKNPRHTRSGFPDLTLWNTETKTFKISEVKGPGDRLSHKQVMWLDYLLKLGVDAEVCYVKAVGSKTLKKSISK